MSRMSKMQVVGNSNETLQLFQVHVSKPGPGARGDRTSPCKRRAVFRRRSLCITQRLYQKIAQYFVSNASDWGC
jgi:hypothetical protein